MARPRTKSAPSTKSLIPSHFTEAADCSAAAEQTKRLAFRQRVETEQRCLEAVKAFRDATDALWSAPSDDAKRSLIPSVHEAIIGACAALSETGLMASWERIDHDRTYTGFREHNNRFMSRPSYDWSRELLGMALAGRLPPEALAETWQTAGLRDAVRWLRNFIVSLSGEGAVLPMLVQAHGPARRACYDRDQLWLRWSIEGKMKAAAIRDKWNAEYARHGGLPIGSNRSGCYTVKEGVRKATAESRKQKKVAKYPPYPLGIRSYIRLFLSPSGKLNY
ncbi:MAG TPA: hypothetical protein DDY78_02710 [Planctomycetales bacterium]|jgi:hypothetical protein|nr:hypothetical protein [Planctomycetales bacterium]